MTQETRRQVPVINGAEVKSLLKQGYTRYAADDQGFGSIEARYGLTPAGVKRLFQNEKLKGLKTTFPEFEYVDDIPDEEVEDDVVVVTRETSTEELVNIVNAETTEEVRPNVFE